MSKTIGIDLGTTNTCMAFVSNQIPRVIATESGFNTMPSVVTFAQDGSLLVGQAAKELMVRSPKRTLHSIKRLLGRQFNSKVVQALRNHFTYAIVPGEGGEAAVQIDDDVHSCAEIQSHMLRQIKRYAEIQLGDEIPDVVIAVPAYYSDHQRSLVKQAGTLAGWNVRRIVNEPTAAALAYGFNRGFDQKILIYDLGGGTFDVSILEVTENVFQVVATGGDMFLGGADFDAHVQAWIVDAFRKKTKIDLTGDAAAMQQVRGAAERAKIELSLLANTQIRLPGIIDRRGKPVDLELLLDRDTLNDLTRGLVDRTMEVVDKVLGEINIDKNEIDEVIPVGGQTRMPLVVDTLTNHFGKSPRKGIHPDECVALGAALLGDSLSKIDAVTLLDTLSVPIGIPDADDNLDVVIDKNLPLPHTATITRPTTSDDQKELQFDICQAEAGTPIRDSEYLGTLRYTDIPAAPAGEVVVTIELELDAEGMLSISASNSHSDAKRSIKLATVERPAFSDEPIEERQGPNVSEPELTDGAGIKGLVKSLWKKG